jgi:hypothetical protein
LFKAEIVFSTAARSAASSAQAPPAENISANKTALMPKMIHPCHTNQVPARIIALLILLLAGTNICTCCLDGPYTEPSFQSNDDYCSSCVCCAPTIIEHTPEPAMFSLVSIVPTALFNPPREASPASIEHPPKI